MDTAYLHTAAMVAAGGLAGTAAVVLQIVHACLAAQLLVCYCFAWPWLQEVDHWDETSRDLYAMG
jgi:hypothetical protein